MFFVFDFPCLVKMIFLSNLVVASPYIREDFGTR